MLSPKIAVVVFAGISPLHLSIPSAVFGEDRRSLGLPLFDFCVCAEQQGGLLLKTGLTIVVEHRLEALDDADIVVVPSWRNSAERPAGPVLEALRVAAGRGAMIVGLCLGSFVLAEAGLLDGRAATTHWTAAELLRQRYPAIEVRPDVLYVDEGQILTSAGVAAGLDCLLHVVRRLYGAESAARLARHLVVAPHRQGGQAQFIERPIAGRDGDSRLALVIETIRHNVAGPHDIDGAAALAHMSRRTFTRHFQASTGVTFAQWLLEERLLLARRLLETTGQSIEDVAQQAGFATAASLRQHFASRLGTTPARYRQEFALA
ncbi:helix-turn-helix domain-containing protein [Devosia sp.]